MLIHIRCETNCTACLGSGYYVVRDRPDRYPKDYIKAHGDETMECLCDRDPRPRHGTCTAEQAQR